MKISEVAIIVRNKKGSSMVMNLFILMVLLTMAGLIIDGGRVLLAYNQLFNNTCIAAEANLAAYDRELWNEEGRVRINFDVAEEIITNVLNNNMKGADITTFQPTSENSLHIETQYTVPISIFDYLGDDKGTVHTSTDSFTVN